MWSFFFNSKVGQTRWTQNYCGSFDATMPG